MIKMNSTQAAPQIATLTYLKHDTQFTSQGLKPYKLIGVQPTAEVPVTNMQFEQCQVPITDLRRVDSDKYTLERNGFQLVDWPITLSSNEEASSQAQNEIGYSSMISMQANLDHVKEYCRKMSDRLQDEVGAEKVFIYEFRFRSDSLPSGQEIMTTHKPLSVAERFAGNPALVVHTDHSQQDGLRRMHQHLTTQEIEKYLLSGKYRIRCINIWRSFNTTSHDFPLAICIPQSIATADIQTIEKVTPDVCSESYYLYHNKNHQWVWVSDMMPSEVLAFTTWDSTGDISQRQENKSAFHSAFPNPIATEPGEEHAPRESLELRFIVVQKLS